MDRSVLRHREQYQLSYELPHEAYTSYVYPRQSANGSTVIIYGHDQGLRVVWYAGKMFKPPKKDDPRPKTNGTAKSEAVVIDLDDDDDDEQPPAEETPIPPAEFEEDEEEIDPAAPYRDIIRHLDISLGSAALRIAAPHIAKDIAQAPPDSWPSIYLDRIIIAVACADSSLRVIAAPLTPPSAEVHDISKLDIQTLKIFGPNSHQEFISDVAITHTSGIEEQFEDDNQSRTRNQTRSQATQSQSNAESPRWSLLIASISSTGPGLLLVHQIPVQDKDRLSTKSEHFLPIRRQFLRSSAIGSKVAFNTSPYPSDRHSSLLITLPAAFSVKLYQVFLSSARERRGSTATSDSASSKGSLRTSSSDRGKFLATFLPPFIYEHGTVIHRRKQVLDAQWIAGGRAILALLEDGEWGIWDLEAVGPASSTTRSNLIRGQSNISGVQGGSLTKFAIRSNIFPSEANKKKSADGQTQPASGSLAPMTPSTRKVRSDGLFQGAPRQVATQLSSQSKHGSISVQEQLPQNSRPYDESVAISYGGENIYISSVIAFWKTEIKPVRLPVVRLGGQEQRTLAVLPELTNNNTTPATGLFSLASTAVPNFLVQTSHRLILSVTALSDATQQTSASLRTVQALPLTLSNATSDQALLKSGVLDVDGMDRILDNMGGASTRSRPLNLLSKNVAFQNELLDEDEDMDVDVASPTPSRYSAPRPEKPTGRIAERMQGSFDRGQPSTQRRVFT